MPKLIHISDYRSDPADDPNVTNCAGCGVILDRRVETVIGDVGEPTYCSPACILLAHHRRMAALIPGNGNGTNAMKWK